MPARPPARPSALGPAVRRRASVAIASIVTCLGAAACRPDVDRRELARLDTLVDVATITRTIRDEAHVAPAPTARVEVTPAKRVFTPSRAGCETVPVFAEGEAAGSVCAEDASNEALTVIDLSDTWTPRVFAPSATSKDAPEYRAKYLELAASSSADLGLNGIAPNLSVLASRLVDDKRVACNAAIDRGPVLEVDELLSGDIDERETADILKKKAQAKEALVAIQAELICQGFLKKAQGAGVMNASTQGGLEALRRRHMIVGAGLDRATVHALSLGGDELAYRALLRGLRERVADAAGLIEDGTASEMHALVVDRELDLTRFAPALEEPIPGGAPDLVDIATDRAARALGWTSPDAARASLVARGKDGLASTRVAVALPPAPSYHSAAMELRVEIDRGDVFYESPGAAAVARKKLDTVRPPTFVVYAKDGDHEVALMRWATTIGGWKKERAEDGEISLKYKESDVGDRVWRQIIAAPAWLPPESTPETDLLHEDKDGNFALKRDLILPGYRNAYGLVMLIHHEEVTKDGKTKYLDHGIRTHGSVDYKSIKRGTSHGCHRLYNQLALRLSGFLLEHRNHARKGKMQIDWSRTLEHAEQTIDLEIPTRGYLYELDPPVPVRVLEGNVLGEARKPMSSIALDTDGPKKS